MLNKFIIKESKITETNEDSANILVYMNPDSTEKSHLIENYMIDEHTLNSSIDPDELSRIEFEPEHVAIIYKKPVNYSGKELLFFKVSSFGIFLFNDKLILVLPDIVQLFEGKYFSKINSLQDLMLKIIYGTIFHFLEHLKVFNLITDELEKKINESMENKYLINLFTLEKSLVYYLNAINSNSLVIEKIKFNSAKFGLSSEEIEFLEDLTIDNTQCYKQADIYSNILANLMDARVSIVSNNINLLMKTLNIITICIMVPTLVVSIFSMNVGIPFQDIKEAFWIIMGIALASMLSIVFIWKKFKW